MRIDEAFCLADKKMYTAEEFKEKIATLRGVNREAYLKFLVCPYCKVPSCEFVKPRSSAYYFELNDEQQHRAGCVYDLDEYQQDRIKADLQMRKTTYLEQALNMVYNLYLTFPNSIPRDEKVLAFRRVPQKRIDTILYREDYGKYKIFYGTVLVESHFTEAEKHYLLKSKKDNSVICKIAVTDTVFTFLPTEYKTLSPTEPRFICFLGYLKKDFPDHINEQYYTTNLMDSRLIKIET